jgi:hypothetical protein
MCAQVIDFVFFIRLWNCSVGMVYVQMTEMAQLCVHVTVTGRAVNVNVSLFRVLYDVIRIANICLYYTCNILQLRFFFLAPSITPILCSTGNYQEGIWIFLTLFNPTTFQ